MTSYRVPPLTIQLGTVLEAAIRIGREHVVIHEWRGMQLLSDEDALERARPKLYLVRGKRLPRTVLENVAQRAVDFAAENYRRWGKRAADALYELDSKIAKYEHGRCMRLDYKSDKWGPKGRTIEYTHDFTEDGGRPPKVYADTKTLEKAHTVVIFGGSMTVSEGGIA